MIGTGQFTKDDDERMSLLFDSFDTSGDRFISFEEFIIGAIVCTEGSFEHKAERMIRSSIHRWIDRLIYRARVCDCVCVAVVFKSIDTDGNRFLTHDELLRRLLRVHYLKHKGNVSQEAVQAALQEIFVIDDNKDGTS